MPRIAKSLDRLRAQINALAPNRKKTSDGWIGDAAHQATKSDHNPNPSGVVQAIDITHDPAGGVDTWKMAETLRQHKDQRIKYVISNGRIFSSTTSPWQWRPYTGSNRHAQHIHVSVRDSASLYDDDREWNLSPAAITSPAPVVALPRGVTLDMRRRMAKKIVDFEARRDSQGRLAVYAPPANDGGGAFEVAGINVRYHPDQAQKLRSLILQGRHEDAEESVITYLLNYTSAAAGWTTDAGSEFYNRDTIFNRGPTGAAKILQMAVGVEVDGQIGPTTRDAIAKIKPADLLLKLRAARERYEREVVGYRANFWRGLVNRWDKALTAAQAFQREQGNPIPNGTVPVAVGVGVFAWLWTWVSAHPILSILVGAAVVALCLFVWNGVKEFRDRPPAEPIAPTPAQEETAQ